MVEMFHNQQTLRRSLSFILLVCILSVTWLLCAHSPQFVNQVNPSLKRSEGPEKIPPLWTNDSKPTSRPPSCGLTVPEEQKAPFVKVGGTKTLLVSAYREHRTGKNEVRVISVVKRSEAVAYHCSFCCGDQLQQSVGELSIHSDHFGFTYGTGDIMCPVPPGCEDLSHIAVTSSSSSSAAHDDQDKTFLEVKNQEKRDENFAHNFTVCLSTMFNFNNVLQLVQSLEMMKLLGVSRVVVYKTSCSEETQRVLDYYTDKGLVEVIPWTVSRFVNVSQGWLPEHGPGDLHYYGQIPALNDCVYRYMYESRYVALQDVDELILPQWVSSWSELLPQLEKKYGADRCYEFEQNLFPNTVALPPPSPQTLPPHGWHKVPGVNILHHLYQLPVSKELRYSNFKIIVNPRAVFITSVHGLLASQKGCSWVDRSIARMYHTRKAPTAELKPDELLYDGRLLSFIGRLTPAVSAVLQGSGFTVDSGLSP